MTIPELIGCWWLTSLTLGTAMTWGFFYGDRHSNEQDRAKRPTAVIIPFPLKKSFQQ